LLEDNAPAAPIFPGDPAFPGGVNYQGTIDFTVLSQGSATVPSQLRKTLTAEGRKTNNYLFTGADTEALLKALDPEAPGPVPHTVLVAPGGKILYRQTGQLDAAELQTKVVEELGPYYDK